MPVIKTEQHKHTLWATINRPNSRNAVNFEVIHALEQILDQLENDDSILTFVLRGEGDQSFISGGDLKEFHTLETAEEAKPMARRMLNIYQRLEQLPCWTIACINGAAYGGGCETMLAFDFRIASGHATFGLTQGRFYLPPGWGGLTRLVERVGRSTALKWLAEAAVINAEDALRHKLIDRVVAKDELNDKTLEWAEQLSKNDRQYIDTLKKGALRLTEARWKAIEAELEPFAKFWEDERHQERVQKFLDRKS
ncbi:MAG: enoyl-CoA hydratase/isomerase family protein [Balneolaceae bacterium]|nr:enoyl-CoA hydratase/isomerase family protein [Balneolaceae bacterium]